MGTPTTIRSQKYRASLRESGLRPIQLWVADTRRADFAAECRRQSRSLHGAASEAEANAWADAAAASVEGWR